MIIPTGRAWRVIQHKQFENKIIPLYFRHGRFSSFARQVNGWGFRRIVHGPDYVSRSASESDGAAVLLTCASMPLY